MSARWQRHWIGAAALLLATGAHAEDKAIELPLSGPAYRLAQQAYRAYDRGDYATAAGQAREALRLRPDAVRLQELLANALAAQKLADARAAGPSWAHKTAPDPAFAAAERAYKAYDRGEFDSALAAARRAVALAPANVAYRLLLVKTLIAAGQLEQARAALEAAQASVPDRDGVLEAQLPLIRANIAEQSASATYRALDRGDVAEAAVTARQALELAPDRIAYRLLLLQALARGQHWDEAQQVVAAGLALDGGNSPLLVMRGFLHQRGGRNEAAQADFARAMRQPGHSADIARNIALIAADAALAAGAPRRALDLLAPFGGSAADAPVQARLHAAHAALERAGAVPGTPASLALPQLDCSATPQGQDCMLLPGGAPTDTGFEAASAAYAAMAARDYPLAVEHARSAVAAAPGRIAYQRLLLSALQSAQLFAQAETVATTLLEAGNPDAALLMQRGMLRKRLGKIAAARADFSAAEQLQTLAPPASITLLAELGRRSEAAAVLTQALEQGELDTLSDVDVAYLAAGAGDSAVALAHFERADAHGLLPASALQDAAYAALHVSRNNDAIAYFQRSNDAARAGKLALDEAERFAVRRAVSELSRTWGVFAALSYRGAGALRGIAGGAADAGGDGLQAGAEAYWRPFGSRDGKQFELFARGYQSLRSDAGGPTGDATLQGEAGARIKPFGGSNLFFSVSRLLPGGTATRTDWLVQASYFHGHGTDLRVDAASWWTAQVALDAGHYFNQPQNYGSLSAQVGRSFRAAASHPRVILFPHLVLAHDYNSALSTRNAAGIGPGLTVRYWFREDAYAAPRSYVDLSLQYRTPLSGTARARGVFLTATISY
jgi:adsorption protein A